jgi:hypothetical protein
VAWCVDCIQRGKDWARWRTVADPGNEILGFTKGEEP